jgi:hypothetical protein
MVVMFSSSLWTEVLPFVVFRYWMNPSCSEATGLRDLLDQLLSLERPGVDHVD